MNHAPTHSIFIKQQGKYSRLGNSTTRSSNYTRSIGVSGFKGIFDFGKALAGNIAPALNVAFSSGGASAASAYTSFLIVCN